MDWWYVVGGIIYSVLNSFKDQKLMAILEAVSSDCSFFT